MIDFIKANYEWIFSGIGSGFLFWLLGSKYGHKKATKQNMKTGNNSSAIQVGRDYKEIKK